MGQNINSQKNNLCFAENRIADVIKIKAMRQRKSRYTIFLLKDRQKLPKEHDYRLYILSIPNKPLFHLFRQFCYWEQNWRNTIPESE